MMKRRQFISLLGGAAAAWPMTARGQQGERVRRIGVLMSQASGDPVGQARNVAFVQGLQELGWTIGRDVHIDYRWAAEDVEQSSRRNATELVALAPDVILATGGVGVEPLLQITRTVPIVFVQVTDPVGAGYVESLARPGGNATGFIPFEYSIGGKWLELLKELSPRVTRAAVLRDAALALGSGQLGAIQALAPSVGVELRPVGVGGRIRDRARCHGLRTSLEWRVDRDGERASDQVSRPDHRVGDPTPIASGVLRPFLRHRRRTDLLRA